MKEWTKEEIERLVPEFEVEIKRGHPYIIAGEASGWADNKYWSLLLQTRLDLETANKQLEGFKAQYNRDAEIITRLRGALERIAEINIGNSMYPIRGEWNTIAREALKETNHE